MQDFLIFVHAKIPKTNSRKGVKRNLFRKKNYDWTDLLCSTLQFLWCGLSSKKNEKFREKGREKVFIR